MRRQSQHEQASKQAERMIEVLSRARRSWRRAQGLCSHLFCSIYLHHLFPHIYHLLLKPREPSSSTSAMSAPSTTASPTTITVSPVPASSSFTTPPPALTTPYVFPPECTRVYNLRSANSTYQSFAQLSETFLYVQTEQAHYQSCQPPGSTSREGHDGRAYSAAVCPSGWMAWSVGLKSRFSRYSGAEVAGNEVSSTWSSAYCCER